MKRTARAVALAAIEQIKSGKMVPDSYFSALTPQDRDFARALVDTSLRQYAHLRACIEFLIAPRKGLKPKILEDIVLLGLAQILFLSTPDHAAVSETVSLTRLHDAAHASGIVNALLRRASREKDDLLALAYDPTAYMPDWMHTVFTDAPGFLFHIDKPAALDLCVRDAKALEGVAGEFLLPDVFRVADKLPVEQIAGFAEGAWWVQDIASTLPVRMLGNVAGKRILDVCAAPGGKTMQLAAAGAKVTALDSDAGRLKRLSENLDRTELDAQVVCHDALTFKDADGFDAVVLDAPCSALGTLRRHPEMPFLHTANKLAGITKIQTELLTHCATLVRPGGKLIYAVCSMVPAETDAVVANFLATHPNFTLTTPTLPEPLAAGIRPNGTVLLGDQPKPAMNGFFAGCFVYKISC